MESNENAPDATQPMMPPSEVGDLPHQPSRWPTAIGATSIVLGSLGLVCYGCGSVQTMLGPMLMASMPADKRPPTAQGLQLFLQIFSLCAAFGLTLWLLIAGIGLVRRRSWSRAHFIGWSVAKILLGMVGMIGGVLFAAETIEQMNSQLEQAKIQFRLTEGMVIGLVAISQAWYLLWPLFLLIWFARGAVKDEVAAWAAESRAMI